MVKIFCWNVAGLRALLKKGSLECLRGGEYDIVCFQETKALPEEVCVPSWLDEIYTNRYWQSNYGKGQQKKGLSGTAIWSKNPGIQLAPPSEDLEGRITTVEFENYIVVTCYTVNSQEATSQRLEYRTKVWDVLFRKYIEELKNKKQVIVCGDLNVSHLDIDIYDCKKYKNKIPCFFDSERSNAQELLDIGLIDSFRYKNGNIENQYTYWNQRFPQMRKTNRGFRIDYFLVDERIKELIISSNILSEILGSDHCPISININVELLKNKEETKNEKPKKLIKKVKLKIINKLEN
jgi:exodeoxyribonuclease III